MIALIVNARDVLVARLKTQQQTIKTDQAAINSARLNLVYCHITSPIDGRVGLYDLREEG